MADLHYSYLCPVECIITKDVLMLVDKIIFPVTVSQSFIVGYFTAGTKTAVKKECLTYHHENSQNIAANHRTYFAKEDITMDS